MLPKKLNSKTPMATKCLSQELLTEDEKENNVSPLNCDNTKLSTSLQSLLSETMPSYIPGLTTNLREFFMRRISLKDNLLDMMKQQYSNVHGVVHNTKISTVKAPTASREIPLLTTRTPGIISCQTKVCFLSGKLNSWNLIVFFRELLQHCLNNGKIDVAVLKNQNATLAKNEPSHHRWSHFKIIHCMEFHLTVTTPTRHHRVQLLKNKFLNSVKLRHQSIKSKPHRRLAIWCS